tara:strand:+ start:272 stop:460 length:189 start_codon:yes stop_codon:yes gene_type:complete
MKAIYKAWKDKYIDLINKISMKKGWSTSDLNPFFYIIFDHLHRSNADSLREFKKQLKQRGNK